MSFRTRVVAVAALAAVIAVASALAGGCAIAARATPDDHSLAYLSIERSSR